jgi:hypothetical protein
MPATVIPVKGLYLGFVGNISNEGYSLRTARQVNPTDTLPVAFGETFVLNSNNTYSSVKQFLLNGAGSFTASVPVGIATSNVNINPTYSSAGSNDVLTPAGSFLPGNIMDGLVQGTINVTCYNGTPTAGGSVWIRTAYDSAITAGVVGGLEAEADPNPITALTVGTTNGSTTVTPSGMTGLVPGMLITSTNIPAGTFIVSVGASTIVVSNAATGTASGTAATFNYTVLYPNFLWKTGYLETDDTAQVTILQRQIA